MCPRRCSPTSTTHQLVERMGSTLVDAEQQEQEQEQAIRA
jgi:hypothetical protein